MMSEHSECEEGQTYRYNQLSTTEIPIVGNFGGENFNREHFFTEYKVISSDINFYW